MVCYGCVYGWIWRDLDSGVLYLSSEKHLFILNRKNIATTESDNCREKESTTNMVAHLLHKFLACISCIKFSTFSSTLVHAVIPALHPILRSFAEGAHMSCSILLLLYNTSLYCSHDQILPLILCVWLERGKKHVPVNERNS